MSRLTLKKVSAEAKLLLIGIPVAIWTLMPIYHLVLFAISPQGAGGLGPALARRTRRCTTSRSSSTSSTTTSSHFWLQMWNSVLIAVAVGAITLFVATTAAFAISRLRVQGRPHGDEPGALHLLHPGRLPRRADVQDDGQLRPAQQPVGADPGDGDDRLAVLHLGAEAGLRQAAPASSTRRRASTARRRCSCSAWSTCR